MKTVIRRARELRSTMTRQEVILWIRLRALKEIGLHFRRQVPMEGYFLDFACLRYRLIIEVDGHQHGFGEQARHDDLRDARLAAAGFKTLRFCNHEIDGNADGVVERILIEIDPGLVEDLS